MFYKWNFSHVWSFLVMGNYQFSELCFIVYPHNINQMTFKWSQINIPHTSLNDILIFQIYARLSFSALLAIDRQFVLLSGLVIDNIHDSFELIDNTQ